MIPHNWISEEVDCGNIGVEDFWKCSKCGAFGGLAYNLRDGSPSTPRPFINGRVNNLQDLPDDCEESDRIIKEYFDYKVVAIYGGSFNPVTWGHVVSVVNFFLVNGDLDEVLVVPCFQQQGKQLIEFHHRYKMCELAFGSLNKVTVSDVEYRLEGESLTHRLVTNLSSEHPNWKMRLILGSDLRESYKSWEGVEIIDKLAPPLIVPRPGFSKKEDEYGQFLNVSSTLVRSSLKMNKLDVLERALPGPVLNYIKENKLYT